MTELKGLWGFEVIMACNHNSLREKKIFNHGKILIEQLFSNRSFPSYSCHFLVVSYTCIIRHELSSASSKAVRYLELEDRVLHSRYPQSYPLQIADTYAPEWAVLYTAESFVRGVAGEWGSAVSTFVCFKNLVHEETIAFSSNCTFSYRW